jgi:ribokinase
VTLGERGAVYGLRGEVRKQSAPYVDVVDTVGAGDAFTGALAAALDYATELSGAMREGDAAGALACTRPGAQEALPRRDDIVRVVRTLSMDEPR